jgi:hypothetical protein
MAPVGHPSSSSALHPYLPAAWSAPAAGAIQTGQEVNAIPKLALGCSYTVIPSALPCAPASDVTVLQILHGGVEAPREMQPLYGILNAGTHRRRSRVSACLLPTRQYLHAGTAHAFIFHTLCKKFEF